MSPLDINSAAEESLADLAAPVIRPEYAEGAVARLIEQQAAKLPLHWFLFGALGSMAALLGCELADQRRASRFIRMWPTPLLVLGIDNKLVKTLGTR